MVEQAVSQSSRSPPLGATVALSDKLTDTRSQRQAGEADNNGMWGRGCAVASGQRTLEKRMLGLLPQRHQ